MSQQQQILIVLQQLPGEASRHAEQGWKAYRTELLESSPRRFIGVYVVFLH